MSALLIFFVVGLLLGVIGQRLLSRWERPSIGGDRPGPIGRHHS